jgi:undecaprenyl pyrophosphate phosphatase UppP
VGRSSLSGRLVEALQLKYAALSEQVARYPALYCLVSLIVTAALLVYFDTEIGRKLRSFSVAQILILVAGLCFAFANICTQNRAQRFIQKEPEPT